MPCVINPYFCAVFIKYAATMEKKILGIQTPISGGSDRFVLKVVENFDRMTKIAPMTMPAARWKPMPPRTFLDATATPINVRMKIVHGSAVRRYSSISYFFPESSPLACSYLRKARRSEVFIISICLVYLVKSSGTKLKVVSKNSESCMLSDSLLSEKLRRS